MAVLTAFHFQLSAFHSTKIAKSTLGHYNIV